jgi:hypothetical protein
MLSDAGCGRGMRVRGLELRYELGCGMRDFGPMQGAEEECGMRGLEARYELGCGMRDFGPMQGAEEECGMGN